MKTDTNRGYSVSKNHTRADRQMAHRLTCISSYVASIAGDATDETARQSWRLVALIGRLHNHLYNIERLNEDIRVQERVRSISSWVRSLDEGVRCDATAKETLQLANRVLAGLAKNPNLLEA